jgi:crotonobetainyl-CoA:carnitine CoA-transferase CaiB-like acyl-CoA transferase
VPVAPVFGIGEALDNPRVADMLDTVTHPDKPGGMRILANPIKRDGKRLPNRASPKLGADTDAILAEVGYTTDAIAELRAAGTV